MLILLGDTIDASITAAPHPRAHGFVGGTTLYFSTPGSILPRRRIPLCQSRDALAKVGNIGIDGVRVSSRQLADKYTLLPQETVQQAAFADIGSPNNRDLQVIVFFFVFGEFLAFQRRKDRISRSPTPNP